MNKTTLMFVIDAQVDQYNLNSKINNNMVNCLIDLIDKQRRGEPTKFVFTQDCHSCEASVERVLMPDHCCTEYGADFISEIKSRVDVSDSIVIKKNTFAVDNWKVMIKSAFNLEEEGIEEIVIAGIPLETSVVSNALALRSVFPNTRIIVPRNCCAGASEMSESAVYSVMKNCLIEVIN